MTSFVSYPSKRYELPSDGKVTGTYTLTYRGDGSVIARTDGAHINDNNQAIDYRGESWLVTTAFLLRNELAILDPAWSDRNGVTRRQNWSPAPRTYAETIIAAIGRDIEANWDADLDREGRAAGVAQNLHRLEEEESELAIQLAEVRKAIRAERKRLDK